MKSAEAQCKDSVPGPSQAALPARPPFSCLAGLDPAGAWAAQLQCFVIRALPGGMPPLKCSASHATAARARHFSSATEKGL